MSPETTEALRVGREHFNAQRFFEAHEAWETAWRREAGLDRSLLQALIMVAAGCVKATRGEPRGTMKLLTSAAELLPAFHDDAGLNLEMFGSSVRQAVTAAEAWNAGGAALVPTFTLDAS